MTKKKRWYVDNAKFYEAMKEYSEKYKKAEEEGRELPILSDYIGDCFMKIAENLSRARNFATYRYREDMVSDAYFDCVRYAHKFNPEKTKNPFSYFSQICFYAMIRRISKEKKVLYTKFKAINHSEVFGMLHTHMDADDRNVMIDIGYSNESRQKMNDFVEDFERKKEEKKKK